MSEITEINRNDTINYFLPQKTCNKKTLVLDLDETLVHSQFQPFQVESDITLKIELEDELHDIHVMVRPGVKEFLENMGKIYEIVIFTASVSKYADPLLDILDKDKNCKYRLFREHCTQINTCYLKEIKRLGRELKDIVIVDNSPMSYALNPENGLPILTWFDDKEDRELYNISSILEFLSFVPDVRQYISQFVVNDEISYSNVINVFDRYNELLNEKKINNNNKIKAKDTKKIFNKNNSKTKFKATNITKSNNRLIGDNKENISSNTTNINNSNSTNNNNSIKFKKNITFSNLKHKNIQENMDLKISINTKDKISSNSKNNNIINNNKKKEIKFNPKSLIARIKNSCNKENTNPNLRNYNNLNNIIMDDQNINQTTKNKTTKNINFNPNNIISSVSYCSMSNLNIVPNTATNKNTFSSLMNKNNICNNNNMKLKNNNTTKIIKHRKSDSTNGLHLSKKIYETNSININKTTQFQHSNSIILNKKTKTNSSNYNISNNISLKQYTNDAHTTKNKNSKDIQLSMRISRDIGQDLEQSQNPNENLNKKLSKSLTREKIAFSFSSKNKNNSTYKSIGNYNNNTFSNKPATGKSTKPNYIYHKKHRSINATFIPFPFTTKNIDSKKILDKKINDDANKNSKNNSINKANKNSINNNNNKHKRFLSTSESYSNNLNNIYSTNTNHSSIMGSSSGNTNNIFLNNLAFKNKQKNAQNKIHKLTDLNVIRTDRNKENINPNYNFNTNKKKKKENKIPFNIIKKRNSINENAFKKKIPICNVNKKIMVNSNNKNDLNSLGYNKKNISYNSDSIPGVATVETTRPKSTKQIMHNKNENSNNKVEVNSSSNNKNIKVNSSNNLNIKKKEISVSKSSRTSN